MDSLFAGETPVNSQTTTLTSDQADRDVLDLDVLQRIGVVQRYEHEGLPPAIRNRRASLSVFSRNPKHIRLAPVIGMRAATKRKSESRLTYFSAAALTISPRVRRKCHHQPLGAARDRAGEMQMRGRRRAAARQDEGLQRLEVGVQLRRSPLEPRHLRRDDAQRLVGQRLAGIGRREIGAEIEEVVLDAHQHRVELGHARRVQARQADRGIGLVDRAIGLDAQIVLQPARAGRSPVVPSSPVLV